ncbi:hypothetical protein Syun_007698 [Stephania yunnanensis]|uniref:Uncharacterized protein n=1 Tax=Stephania yunnanensis TaxID=152371 RepID=A0AAP0L0M9_9MAGN
MKIDHGKGRKDNKSQKTQFKDLKSVKCSLPEGDEFDDTNNDDDQFYDFNDEFGEDQQRTIASAATTATITTKAVTDERVERSEKVGLTF